ncbi:MAG: cytochrome c biogenesis protein ResB [Bdellovibrionales bacterium]
MNRIFDRGLRFLASLRLAVVVIVGLAVISAIGTVYEARYDSEVATKLVYHSPYMYFILGLLVVNLVAVMVDRWPWKQHHAAFVLAHVGIIVLLFGSWLTYRYGVDGSIAFEIGEERNTVTVKNRDLMVWASLDGSSMANIYNAEVDFLVHPPTSERPFFVNLGSDELRFTEYQHFAFRESEIRASSAEEDGPAVRFQLENPNVNLTEWLRRERGQSQAQVDLGPARVVLARDEASARSGGRNEIFLISTTDKKALEFIIYNKDKSIRKRGRIREAEMLETGWMGLKFRVLRYLPHATETIQYVPAKSASPLANSAAKFTMRGKEYWVGLNSALRLYLDDRAYYISYAHRQLELGFPLRLKNFRVGTYQGTERAASYESEVEVPGQGTVLVSMNEPLKHEGYTFYQASFQRDEQGRPVVSILSVNYDPGRWLKYLGSLLIVLGSIMLFYFKRVKWIKKDSKKEIAA